MSLIGDLLRLLAQTNSQGGQVTGSQAEMSQMIGGLLGSSQAGGGGGQVLGALEQMMASPGQGNVQNMNLAANNPMLNMVQPIAEQLSRKTGLQPQAAQAVVSLILHRMMTSHPAFGSSNARLNLPEVLQQLASSGAVPPEVLHSSGMVNDLVNTHGMDPQAAIQNLNEVFSLLGSHMQNPPGR